MSKTSTVKTPSTRTSKAAKVATSKTSKPAAAKPRTPKAAVDPAHKYETASPEAPCIACGTPWVHAKALCSSCFNRARKPMAAGLKGDALIAVVQEKIAKRSSAKASSSKPPTKRTAKAQPQTTLDALELNKVLYGQAADEEVAPAF